MTTKYWSLLGVLPGTANKVRIELLYNETLQAFEIWQTSIDVPSLDVNLGSVPFVMTVDRRYAVTVGYISDNTTNPSIALGLYFAIGRCRENTRQVFTFAASPVSADITGVIAGAESSAYANSTYQNSIMWDAISHLWVREEMWSSLVHLAFQNDPELFSAFSGISSRTRGDFNCIFYARLLSNSLVARIGFDSLIYEDLTWTPVTRDYVVRRGEYEIPTIKARYIKLEFSQLSPTPYDTPDFVELRMARVYPEWVENWFRATRRDEPLGSNQDYYLWPSDEYEVISNNGQYESVPRIRHKRFYTTSRHIYDWRSVPVDQKFQYFIGLHQVKFYRNSLYNTTQAGALESTIEEIRDSFYDESQILVRTLNYNSNLGLLSSSSLSQIFESKVVETQTNVLGIQLAVQGSEWLSKFTSSQILLNDTSYLSYNSSRMRTLAGAFLDYSGNVIELYDSTSSGLASQTLETGAYSCVFPGTDGADNYDTSGLYDISDAYDSIPEYRIRLSAVLRIYLPDTSAGTYVLTIKGYDSGNTLYTVGKLTLPTLVTNTWYEFILNTITGIEPKRFVLELVQTTGSYRERCIIGQMSLHHNAFLWQVSNDGGTTWIDVPSGINDPLSFIAFPSPNNQLAVKALSSDTKGTISEYLMVPWYGSVGSLSKTQSGIVDGISQSESELTRSVKTKPLFKLSSTPIVSRL